MQPYFYLPGNGVNIFILRREENYDPKRPGKGLSLDIEVTAERAFLAVNAYGSALAALKAAKDELDAVNLKRGIVTPAQGMVGVAIKLMEGESI